MRTHNLLFSRLGARDQEIASSTLAGRTGVGVALADGRPLPAVRRLVLAVGLHVIHVLRLADAVLALAARPPARAEHKVGVVLALAGGGPLAALQMVVLTPVASGVAHLGWRRRVRVSSCLVAHVSPRLVAPVVGGVAVRSSLRHIEDGGSSPAAGMEPRERARVVRCEHETACRRECRHGKRGSGEVQNREAQRAALSGGFRSGGRAGTLAELCSQQLLRLFASHALAVKAVDLARGGRCAPHFWHCAQPGTQPMKLLL